MYTIIKGNDGKFHCEGMLQDSTERWTRDTFDEAIKSMKGFAKAANGVKIKKKHITFLESVQVVKTELVSWQPFPAKSRKKRK